MESTITKFRTSAQYLWDGGRGWILLSIALGWFLSFGVRNIFPTLVPFFVAEFNISLSVAGLLLTVLWGAYAVGQFPGGLLGDRFGAGNILVFSTATSTVVVVLVSTSLNLWMLFVCTAAFGFATALYAPTRFTVFTDIYPERSGTAIGLTMAAGNVGNSFLPPLASLLAAYYTWRLGFGILVLPFLAVTILLWLTVPNHTSSATKENDSTLSLSTIYQLRDAIGRKGIPLVVAIQILNGFVYQGFVGFYPTYLTEVKGLSPSLAAVLFGLFFATGVIIQPITGVFQDNLGAKRTLLGLLTLFLIGLLILSIGEGLLLLILITMLLSSRTGTGVVNNTYIATVLPDEMKGAGLGLLRTSWILLGATSPILVGLLGDLGYFREAFLLLAGLVAISLFLAGLLPNDPYSEDQ